jgi:phage repressor protein C with HTH and peptisase S24 domain
MGWASSYIAKLKAGETISFRPRGNSMLPKIKSGDLVTVAPLAEDTVIERGDVVLCTVEGHQYLHFVSAVKDGRYQISNASGHPNGRTGRAQIHGKLVSVEP